MSDLIERARADCFKRHISTGKCLVCELANEIERLQAIVDAIQAFINAQAEDEGLWGEAQYASEAYIQRGLRGCHAYIESVIKDGPKATEQGSSEVSAD